MTELVKATADGNLFAPQHAGFSPFRSGGQLVASIFRSMDFARKCQDHYNRHGHITHARLEEIYADLDRVHGGN